MIFFGRKSGEMWATHRKAVAFIWGGIIATCIVTYLVMKYSLALGHWLGWRKINPEQASETVRAYLSSDIGHTFTMFWKWLKEMAKYHMSSNLPVAMWTPFITFPVFFGGLLATYWFCPYMLGPQLAKGRRAVKKDYMKIGFWDGKYIVLGMFKDHILKLNDTRSVLCAGTQGSGKTVGVVIPSILSMDEASLSIIDMKGLIFEKTSGYRAKLGPVFKFDFESVDSPEEGVYYAKWNPLSPGNLPPPSPGRYNYIGGIAAYLVSDGPAGTDPYWPKAGRSALEGFINYLCDKIDAAKANDYFWQRLAEKSFDAEDAYVLESYYAVMPKTKRILAAKKYLESGVLNADNYVPIGQWDPLPPVWHGKSASLAMLVDLLSSLQVSAAGDIKRRKEMGDYSAYNIDPLDMILQMMQEECVGFAYSRRALLEINQLGSVPSKQRSSIMSFALAGLAPFKNSAVRERTSATDITFREMRGMVNPTTGKFEPVTLYMNADEYGISPFLTNMSSAYLMSYTPNMNGHGPFPVFYILDDFGVLSKMPAVLNSVGSGRSQKVGFLICVQDLHQIKSKYSEEALDILMTNTAVKIVKRQNNPTNAAVFTALGPKWTQKIPSWSQTRGFGKDINHFKWSTKYSYRADGIIGGSGVNNMVIEKQTIFIQGFLNLACQILTPLYYKNEEFSEKASIKEAPCISDERRENRPEEEKDIPKNVIG